MQSGWTEIKKRNLNPVSIWRGLQHRSDLRSRGCRPAHILLTLRVIPDTLDDVETGALPSEEATPSFLGRLVLLYAAGLGLDDRLAVCCRVWLSLSCCKIKLPSCLKAFVLSCTSSHPAKTFAHYCIYLFEMKKSNQIVRKLVHCNVVLFGGNFWNLIYLCPASEQLFSPATLVILLYFILTTDPPHLPHYRRRTVVP